MINTGIVNQDLTPQGYIYKDMVKHPFWDEDEDEEPVEDVRKTKKEENK